MSQSTWFRVGGPAEVIFKPTDIDDLCQFLIQKPSDLPCYPLGAGSNVLVRDAGLQGCVIRLGRSFATIEQQENLVILGAGCLDRTVALTTCQLGLSGLEFLVGIPGATSEHLAEALQKNNIPATLFYNPEELAPLLQTLLLPGDMVLCLGAGNITQWAAALPGQLEGLESVLDYPKAVLI